MCSYFNLEIGQLTYRTLVIWQMLLALHISILNCRAICSPVCNHAGENKWNERRADEYRYFSRG